VWQNCKTLKATTLAETSRSESVACCVINISQLFNCGAACIIYVMLAYERFCIKTVSLKPIKLIERTNKMQPRSGIYYSNVS
jgi:hypothetical protein